MRRSNIFLFVTLFLVPSAIHCRLHAADRESLPPNILWLSTEDIGPHVGCYGDAVARTPRLDEFAQRGTLYRTAWSTCPVCAPARTTIITGVYPAATGGEHMRSMVPLPERIRMFPQFLRDAGYYCTNNSKEDYNHPKRGKVWDESSKKAHWKNRLPDQPFFAVFNFTKTHESKIRTRPHKQMTDPVDVQLPAYHPDRPEIRQDWAQYYDNLRVMDDWFAGQLDDLENAGLADDTVVVFFGDHGSGMPRGKRYPGDSGLRVPLIVHVPQKFRELAPADYGAGALSDRLVGFIDLAPTMLSLAGIEPPDDMQGHVFLGEFATDGPEYLYGFRGRMDERIDLVRSIRDQRYVYLRNYMPHRPHGQHVAYQFITPTTRVWKQLFDDGQLPARQARFWEPRAGEELYDLKSDPDEVDNLASSADHRQVLERFRAERRRHALAIRDVMLLPEAEMAAVAADRPPYEFARDADAYPLQQILDACDVASLAAPDSLDKLAQLARSPNAVIRYWAATGFLIRGREAVDRNRGRLRRLLVDPSPSVQVVAAEAVARFGDPDDRQAALAALLRNADHRKVHGYVVLAAMNAIDHLGNIADPIRADVLKLPRKDPRIRRGDYLQRLAAAIAGGRVP